MSIEFKEEVNIEFLREHLWSGAVDTFDTLDEHDRLGQLEQYLNELFYMNGETPTITEINDLLWFESEEVYTFCGLTEDGEEVTEEEDEEETTESDTHYCSYTNDTVYCNGCCSECGNSKGV